MNIEETRAQFEAWVAPRRVIHGFNRIEDMWDAWQAALAARQPVAAADKDSLTVGISTEWVLGYFDTDLPERARDAVRYAFAEYASLAALEPKPAQAVNLGQLSLQNVATLRDMREHMAAGTMSLNDWQGFGTAALDAALALIDSQAVGK